MIEESARVMSIEGKRLLLQAQPSAACGACHARSACGQGLLSKYFQQTPGQISIENRLPSGKALMLQPGDEVIIGIEEASVLKGAFFAYLLPLVFVLSFAAMSYMMGFESEGVHILMTLLGLCLGLACVRYLLQGKHGHLRHMLPVLLRRAHEHEHLIVKHAQ